MSITGAEGMSKSYLVGMAGQASQGRYNPGESGLKTLLNVVYHDDINSIFQCSLLSFDIVYSLTVGGSRAFRMSKTFGS
jgi:hypothetical protein